MMISEKIRMIRMQKGIKQNFIANKLGISAAAYNSIERGRNALKAEMIPKISAALGVDPKIFFEKDLHEMWNDGGESNAENHTYGDRSS